MGDAPRGLAVSRDLAPVAGRLLSVAAHGLCGVGEFLDLVRARPRGGGLLLLSRRVGELRFGGCGGLVFGITDAGLLAAPGGIGDLQTLRRNLVRVLFGCLLLFLGLFPGGVLAFLRLPVRVLASVLLLRESGVLLSAGVVTLGGQLVLRARRDLRGARVELFGACYGVAAVEERRAAPLRSRSQSTPPAARSRPRPRS